MCLGIPMQIVAAEGMAAVCRNAGGDQQVSLALTGPLPVGQHVLVYLGSAVRALEPDEAMQISDAIDALGAAMAGQPFEHLIADLIEREPQLPDHPRTQTLGRTEA